MGHPIKRIRTAILAFKSPFVVQGGSDVRMLGIIRALSNFSEVYVIPVFGKCQVGEMEPNVFQVQSSGQNAPTNHDLFRTIKEHPEDPYADFSNSQSREFVSQTLNQINPDIIIANRLSMWRILTDLKIPEGINQILDLDESAHRLHESFSSNSATSIPWRLQANFQDKVAEYELKVLNDKINIFVCSKIEANMVKKISSAALQVFEIPNVVVDNRFITPILPKKEPYTIKQILFPANFAYPPNRAAFNEIVEYIAPALPEYEFRIAGFGLSSKELNSLRNVSLVSPVPDMAIEFQKSDLLIAPLRFGAGTRVKILEAMKYGLPIIATEFAVEGLGLDSRIHYISVDSPSDFIESILEISQDLDLVNSLRSEAFDYVTNHFSVSSLESKLRSAIVKLT